MTNVRQNMLRFSLVLGAVGLQTFNADAALRYRVDGHVCTALWASTETDPPIVRANANSGMKIEIPFGGTDNDSLICSVPLSSDLVELDDDNGRLLDHVNVRLAGTNGSIGTCWARAILTTHDYDSSDFEVCDDSLLSSCSGSCLRTLDYSTSCGVFDWAATVTAVADYPSCSALEVKLMTVYDT